MRCIARRRGWGGNAICLGRCHISGESKLSAAESQNSLERQYSLNSAISPGSPNSPETSSEGLLLRANRPSDIAFGSAAGRCVCVCVCVCARARARMGGEGAMHCKSRERTRGSLRSRELTHSRVAPAEWPRVHTAVGGPTRSETDSFRSETGLVSLVSIDTRSRVAPAEWLGMRVTADGRAGGAGSPIADFDGMLCGCHFGGNRQGEVSVFHTSPRRRWGQGGETE